MLWPRRAFHRGVTAATLAFTAACAGDDTTGLPKEGPSLTEPTKIVITPSSDTLGVGQSRQLTAVATDANGAPRQATVAWRSVDPTIASVTFGGTVTALAPGLARVVVTAGALADTAKIFVRAIDLVVEPNAVSIAVGDQVQLVATRTSGAAASGGTTTWTSSNEAVAQVAADGTVSALGEGDVTLIATVDGTQGSALMSVHKQTIASIRVTPTTSSLYPGAKEQLAVVGYDDAGRQMAVDPSLLHWSVSDSKILSVDNNGVASGMSKGSAVITARISNKQATASVNVLATPAATITVTLATSTLEVGQTTQATASVADATGAPVISPVIAWQSSNPAIATVNATGVVTAVARGSATISAISDGKTGGAPLTVAAKSVAAVALSPNPAAALPGQTVQLTAVAKDAQGLAIPGKTFSWQSSSAAVATVSSAGLVTAVASGSATISASVDGVTGTAQFSTTQLTVSNLVVNPPTATVTVGQSVQLTATATDALGNVLTGRVPAWASSNPTIATVSSSGNVTTISHGSATITASLDSKTATASIGVDVPPPEPVATITVTLNAGTITVGQTTQAVAALKDANGNVLTGRTITWTSAATALATVSSSGLVSAIAAGSATITATSESKTGNATVVIQSGAPAPVATVALSATSTSMFVGQSQLVTVTLKDVLGNTLTGRTVTWSSSNLAAITVAPSGQITAVGAGNATVTATSEGKSGTMAFTVTTSPVAPVSSVALTATGTSLTVGQTMQVVATLKDSHGTVLTGRTITWSSAAPSVATVSTSGLVSAVAGGTAMISATSEGVTGSIAFSVAGAGGSPTVTVTLASPALVVGQTTQATAVEKDGSGAAMSGTPSWASSNTAIATVSSAGLVSAVGAGSATITATFSGIPGSAPLGVTAAGGTSPNVTPAALPQSTPSFTIPAPTRTYTIATDLQRALDTAKAGDEIRLSGTYSGNYVIPAKACGSWITIRSVAEPPAAGVRVTPSTAAGFAKIVSPNNAPALKTVNPTCGWRLLGVEITGTLPVTSIQYGLVWLGDGGWTGGGETQTSLDKVPQQFVMDRVYLHGSATLNSMRCLALNTGSTVIRDSWFSECHAAGFDSQAIVGWNGPGPYLIENNHLEGAGENIMFGGADPGVPNLVPSDITIRRNHVIKPLTWKGGQWSVKNLFELKSAARLLIEGNVFENNWPAAQEGIAIVLKSNANGCQCTFEGTRDITFRYNIVTNAPVGLGVHAADNSYGWTGFVHTQRVTIDHNLFKEIGAEGRASHMVLTQDLTDILITHNTFLHAASAKGLVATMAYAGGAARRISLRDNVLTATAGYALFYDGGIVHAPALTAMANDQSWAFPGNVVGGMLPEYVSLNPGGSWYPSTVSGIGLATDGSLSTASAYKGKATDATDPGTDFAELNRRTAGAVVP
jgi:uncharacterized protein YjdB